MRLSSFLLIPAAVVAVVFHGCEQRPRAQQPAAVSRAQADTPAKAAPQASTPAGSIIAFRVNNSQYLAVLHNIRSIPRTGETILYGGRRYTVREVEHRFTANNRAADTIFLDVVPRTAAPGRF